MAQRRPAFRLSSMLVLLPLLFALLACGAETDSDTEPPQPAAAPPPEAAATPETAPAGPPWTRLAPPPGLAERRLNAGFLIVDGVYNTELTAPFDIFQHVQYHAKPGIEVFTVSPDGEAVTTFEGLVIGADYSFENAPDIDILVVPSAEHSMDTDLENEAMMSWVRKVGERAHFLVSLCDGAFVLAHAGLLDGLASTTFPGDQDRYAEMFPHLDLRRGVSFVHDGKAITSWGGARSFDPAMYLADHLYGEKATQGIGRGMVIPWPPTAETMPAIVIEPTP
ncbi:MAG: DJ-1/PfpI family protein [Acidobacteriota bacterium]